MMKCGGYTSNAGWANGIMMFTRSFRIINYARRSVLQEWLRERGYDPTKILDFGEYKTIRKI